MPFGGLLAGAGTELSGLSVTLVVFAGVYLLASVPPFTGQAWRGPGRRTGGGFGRMAPRPAHVRRRFPRRRRPGPW
ncbi:hypothetical protein GCM10027176_61310 [Actinoallomurus bryophytorum]|uniref:Uncharacterized protein n=1 Tax=Actinoallomurus bryophytorum TaxID=1490222 RepID=A0A543CP98_9ACTN|nr:hypothetical protein [Actinoallomurus bryophytorum]TQL98926.1 hypothetical protein FB559_4576 [Actinoallomurus bryophytorum]